MSNDVSVLQRMEAEEGEMRGKAGATCCAFWSFVSCFGGTFDA